MNNSDCMASFKKVGNVRGVLDKLKVVPGEAVETSNSPQALKSAEDILDSIFRKTQEANSEFANEIFRVYRRDMEAYADCVVVDGEGRNVLKGEYWATIWGYSNPEFLLPPSMIELLQMTVDLRDIVYPLVPEDNMVLFFLEKDWNKLRSVVGIQPQVSGHVGSESILRVHVNPPPTHKDPFGPAAMEAREIAVGRLGFWEIAGRYYPRIWIRGHPASSDVYISPLWAGKALADGMLLEYMKPRKQHYLRLEITKEVDMEYPDYVEAAFHTYLADERVNGTSLLLRYATPDPVWNSKTFFKHK